MRDESQVKRKDYVFGIRETGAAKAWPIEAFEGGAVINDRVGARNVVLIGDAATRTVRAYYRGDTNFKDLDPSGKIIRPTTAAVGTLDEAFLMSAPRVSDLPRSAWDTSPIGLPGTAISAPRASSIQFAKRATARARETGES